MPRKKTNVAAPLPLHVHDLVKLIAEHAAKLAEGKKAYEVARELEEQIIPVMRKLRGADLKLADGRTAVLVDQFAKKNTVWKPAGVQRFVIELQEPKSEAK